MSKTIKIIDLLNKIANGELKRGTKIIYKNMTFLYDYPNLEGIFLAGCRRSKENNIYNYINTIDIMRSTVEIIEEQEEIDIQEINLDFARLGQFSIKNAKGQEEILEVLFIEVQEKMKELARKINYLDKNIKEK